MNFQKRSVLSFAILSLLGVSVLCAQKKEEELQSIYPNGIAAEVEGDIITVHQLRRQVAPLIPQIRIDSSNSADFDRNLQNATLDVLNSMIDRILIVKEFNRKEMVVPESFRQTEFRRTLLERFDGDRTKYIRYLQQEGKSDAQYKKELTENIIVGFMEREMLKSLAGVSPQRIREFYNENKVRFYQEEAVRLRQIMLAPIANETESVLMQEARAIIKKLESGADFAELAAERSVDDMAENGGDWGWLKRKDMRNELAEVAFSLSKGQYSEPVLLEKYVFILYIEDKIEEGFQPLDDVREQIKQAITTREMREERAKWIQRLRKDAFIKVYI